MSDSHNDEHDNKSEADEPVEQTQEASNKQTSETEDASESPDQQVEPTPAAELEKKAVEISTELQEALEEAIESMETKTKKKEEDEPAPPSEKELELKMEILGMRDEVRALKAELDKKAKEVKQNHDAAKRFQEQVDTIKNRHLRERADWFNYGHEPLLKECLVVVDNLERAIEHADTGAESASLREGVDLTHRQLLQILNKFGVTAIESANTPFNPSLHEAMMEKEDDSVPGHTVIEVHQQGYMLKDRLLRPSMVTVSKRSAQDAATETEQHAEASEVSADKAKEAEPRANDESGTEDPAE